jgi:MFS family permease
MPYRSRMVPIVLACPLFMQSLDTSIIAIALPTLSSALLVDVLDLSLAISSYLLSLAICLSVFKWFETDGLIS